jgi:hypothetical protein
VAEREGRGEYRLVQEDRSVTLHIEQIREAARDTVGYVKRIKASIRRKIPVKCTENPIFKVSERVQPGREQTRNRKKEPLNLVLVYERKTRRL